MQSMYIAVDSLELISSPKTENDEVEKHLAWIEDNLHKINVINNGRLVATNFSNKRIMLKKLNETFRLILIKLEAKGIYTRKRQDPAHAMGDFSGS